MLKSGSKIRDFIIIVTYYHIIYLDDHTIYLDDERL